MPAKTTSRKMAPPLQAGAAWALPRRIVVPTDFSADSVAAVAYARGLAGVGAEFILVHVVLPAGTPDLVYGSLLWDQNQVQQTARTALRKWRTEVGLGRMKKVKLEVRVGEAHREIVATALENHADLIVIPTHGRTGLSHYLLGSTAERVVRHAPCPVLIVRSK